MDSSAKRMLVYYVYFVLCWMDAVACRCVNNKRNNNNVTDGNEMNGSPRSKLGMELLWQLISPKRSKS